MGPWPEFAFMSLTRCTKCIQFNHEPGETVHEIPGLKSPAQERMETGLLQIYITLMKTARYDDILKVGMIFVSIYVRIG